MSTILLEEENQQQLEKEEGLDELGVHICAGNLLLVENDANYFGELSYHVGALKYIENAD